jgi:3-oxoacyl-[acyl-carrier-protein] synthase-3
MNAIRIRYTGQYLPEREVSLAALDQLGYETESEDDFFKAINNRHWASESESTLHMGTQAALNLISEHNVDPASIDLIIFSSLIDDFIAPQSSSGIQHGIGAVNATAINLDTGCASFVSGIKYGALLIRSGAFRKVLVISVSNFAGRAQSKVKNASATIPGDGAGAILLEKTDAERCNFLGHYEKSYGQHHGIFAVHAMDENSQPTKVWKPSQSAAFFFDPGLVEQIKENARVYLPEVMKACLEQAQVKSEDIDVLLTHQPNEFLLDFWRSAMNIPESRHFNTLNKYGNLFQASIAVTLSDSIKNEKVQDGDLVLMSSFAFAGELASAVLIRFG